MPKPKIIVNKRQKGSRRLIGLIAMQERIRRQISIEWWLVYFCIIPSVHLWVAHKGTPLKVHAFIYFFLICCWSRIHCGLNPSMKLTENANESLQQLSLQRFFFFFSQFCIQAADVSEFSFLFFCWACGLTASKGKHSQRLAATPACLHVLFASHLWTGDDLIRPVHQSLSQLGCTSHSEGVRHILVQRCSALVSMWALTIRRHAEMWRHQQVAQKWKQKSSKSQRDSHIYENKYFIFILLKCTTGVNFETQWPKCCAAV